MAIDYQEVLLEAVEIIANNNQSSNNNNNNSNSEKQENKPIPILNPFGQMIQQEKFDIETGMLGESGNNQISYTWIPQHQTKYDLLGLECNITTNGESKGIGTYGIKIFIKASNDNFEQTFDSSMMLGNPWNFKNMLQKQIFDLEEVSNIQSIRITLYNESKKNVTFDNVFLRLGQSVDNLGESSKPLIIYSDNEPQYTSSADGKFLSGLPQTLYARWIYKKDGNYKAITHLNSEDDIPEGFTLRWYRWTPNSNFGDIYGGAYWSHINGNDNEFSYTIEGSSIDPRAEEERYKVIVLWNNLDSDEISVLAESEYYSIKNNIIPVNEQITNRQMKLSDDGKYHFYAWDQEIIDEEFWRSTVQRTATISFETLLDEENFYNAIKSITWRIPEYQTNYVGVAISEIESKDRYSQLTYDKAKLGSIDKMKEAFTITYQISSHLYNDPMNKIQCIIDIGDGIEYLFEKEIEFRVSGSGGTDTSVIIRMVDEHGNVRAAITPGETLYLEAKVYNAEGEEIEPEGIEWKLLWEKSAISNGDLVEKYENGEPLYQSHKGSRCKIISNGAGLNESVSNQPWERGAAAVKALVTIGSYNLGSEENSNYKNLVIEEVFGIAMAEEGSSYIGPKEILYSSSGTNPQYSKSSVGLLGVELKENETLTVETFPEDINNEYPTIRNNIITPKNSLDMSLENKPFGLIFKKGSSIIWIQPIIIGINRYFSSIINEWDGSLQINEDKNYILSSAYVAGGKNGSNRFTGVVMGELGTISNETISPLGTGLFGYYNGVQSFALTAQGGNGEFSGKITALEGSNIAGWETTENVFGKTVKAEEKGDNGSNILVVYGVGMSSDSNKFGTNESVFAIGKMQSLDGFWGNAAFRVTGKGKLYANDADISGVLHSGAGSSLGGWTVSTPNGYVFGNMSAIKDETTGKYYGIGFDTYAVGKTTRALAIGLLGGIEETSSWEDASFYVTGKGKLVAKDAEVTGTIISSGEHYYSTSQTTPYPTSITMSNGKLMFDIDNNGGYNNYSELNARELKFYRTGVDIVDNGMFEIFANSSGRPNENGTIPWDGWEIRAQKLTLNSSIVNGELLGTWQLNSDALVTSWRGAKHDIEQLDNRYSVLFDNLIPVRFKYNNGASGRYHTGLILDELKDAMDIASISTQEFAAYCIDDPKTGEGGIRYGAFISLLIKEVQLLKQELKALKEVKKE